MLIRCVLSFIAMLLAFVHPGVAQTTRPAGAGPATPPAATPGKAPATLFTNARIFDGKSDHLTEPMSVLVEGGVIARIAASIDAPTGATVIDASGRTLMPGLIDVHWHTLFVRPTPIALLTDDIGYTTLAAGVEATDTLMRGFTTVRDMGGPAFSLKRAIDEGLIVGPRIFPCGAMISITGGHGDFRQPSELPRTAGQLTQSERLGGSMIADSPDEVRVRTREQLMLGASQIKLTAGGGVASPHSPLDVSTFTEEELRAAVEAAENWGTYVAVHAYTSASIQRAINAGVKCIEHGHLMDEDTARQIAEKGIWLSIQPFPEELGHAFPPGSTNRQKFEEVLAGTETAYNLAKKHKIKTAFGTDVLFSPALAQRQGALLVSLKRWYTPAEVLVMATSTNAELLALSGPRNPYPGALGVIEPGAYADILLVNGNPFEDLTILARPQENFALIMKNGVIHKNLIGDRPANTGR